MLNFDKLFFVNNIYISLTWSVYYFKSVDNIYIF